MEYNNFDEILLGEAGNYENAKVNDGEYGLIDEGKHLAIIKNVKPITPQGKKPTLFWEIKITEGKFKNRNANIFTDLTGDNISWTKSALKSCGVTLKHLSELKNILEMKVLENLAIEIFVNIKDYQGEPRNNFYINKVVNGGVSEENLKF